MSRAPTAMVQLAVAIMLASACRPVPHEGPPAGADAAAGPLSAADQSAIRATDTAFATAAGAGDAAGMAAMYVPDASLMPPNAATIHGRDEIQKFWGAFVDAYRVNLTLTAEEVEGRGDLAYSRGRYTLDLTPKAKGPAPTHDNGKFLVIFRRGPDGHWRLAADMYSSDLPVPK
jgi:uncharacterized protein (TIGR02246 family)